VIIDPNFAKGVNRYVVLYLKYKLYMKCIFLKLNIIFETA